MFNFLKAKPMLVLLLSFYSYLKYTKFMGHMKDTLTKLKFQTQFWIDFDFHISVSLFLFTYFYLITQAQGMGKAASEFIQEDLKMEYVYDYVFHLLNEHAKLLTFKPIRPRKAVELCAETMACPAERVQKKFFMESMENGPTDTIPCTTSSIWSSISSCISAEKGKFNKTSGIVDYCHTKYGSFWNAYFIFKLFENTMLLKETELALWWVFLAHLYHKVLYYGAHVTC